MRKSKYKTSCIPGCFIFLVNIASGTTTPNVINFTHILNSYALVCGFEYLCDADVVSFINHSHPILPTSNKHLALCPNCTCDVQCQVRRDCCPDVLFGNPQITCANLAILGKERRFLAVTTCPETTKDLNVRNACTKNHTNEESFTHVPVSSKHKTTVYRNKDCAKCHGENETEQWQLSISCNGVVDLNHLSSYDEIFKVADENACAMKYVPPVGRRAHVCFGVGNIDYSVYFTECNMTGQWYNYDQDIEWACKVYNVPYRMYKNVFCYICNPEITSVNQRFIDSCNTTGMWTPFDANLEYACLKYPQSDILFPFKNRFCYLCNRANDIGFLYSDVKHTNEYESTYILGYDGLGLGYTTLISINDFFRIWKQMFERKGIEGVNFPSFPNSTMIESKAMIDQKHLNKTHYMDMGAIRGSLRNKGGAIVNIKQLIEYHYLHFGPQDLCDEWDILGENIKVTNNTPCGCDIECVVRRDCCFDFAISAPVTLFQDSILPVSKCMVKWHSDSPFVASCEDVNRTMNYGYILNLPVRSETSNILYRNIFCFICNEYGYINSDEAFMALLNNSNSSIYNPLDLNIDCDFLLDIQKYFFMEEMISDMLSKSCRITILDNKSSYIRSYRAISRCNETGDWSKYNPDIEWACENYFSEISPFKLEDQTVYRNMFCKMCNVGDSSNIQYTHCNMTGLQVFEDIQLNRGCDQLPAIKTLGLYKNWFCYTCNPQKSELIIYPNICDDPGYGTSRGNDAVPPVLAGTYRNMFSISVFTSRQEIPYYADEDGVSRTFEYHQLYDAMKETYRKTFCIDGKSLRNGKCISLLELTQNLGFIYAVDLTGTVVAHQNTTVSKLMESLQNYFPTLILNALSISRTSIDVKSLYLFTENYCKQSIKANEPFAVSILSHASFYLHGYVLRDKTEEKLLNLTRKTFNFTENGTTFALKSSFKNSAILLPAKIHSFDYKLNCYRVKQNLVYNDKQYKLSLVSKLLGCKQVEIDADQFTSIGDTHQISLVSSERVLGKGDFQLTADGGAIICQDDFEDMMTMFGISEERRFKMILGVTSISFVSLSLLGLLGTFVTYCIFPHLQTLPGKNIMCLMFALFFAQGLIQFGLMQKSNPIVCSLLGILIHYFWLTTFFCMNVCSLHMFKLFVLIFKSLEDDTARSKVFTRYVLYSYGTPAIIIIIHSITSVLTTSDNHIGYGRVTCFISTVPALIATFITPVLIICIVNAFFFSIVAYKLKTSPNMSTKRPSQIDFKIYLKLFILTGVTWICQVIESFFPPSYFSIVVAVFNASQGIFIFLAYCANRRVRSLYQNRFHSFNKQSIITSTTKISEDTSKSQNEIYV